MPLPERACGRGTRRDADTGRALQRREPAGVIEMLVRVEDESHVKVGVSTRTGVIGRLTQMD
jgi:hypothetical protein